MVQVNRGIHWCLVLTASLLAKSFPASIAYEHPVHAVLFLSFATGLILLAFSKSFPIIFGQNETPHQNANVELEDLAAPLLEDDVLKSRQHPQNPGYSRWLISRLLLLGAVAVLIMRIELFRRILKATECTVSSVEVFIPFILSLYDSFRFQKRPSRSQVDLQDQYLDETAYDAVQRRYLASRFRYVLPAFLVSFGCHLTSGLWSGVSSTYICPLVGGQTWAIPIMQYVCAILDCCLAIAAYELCVRKFSKGKRAGTKTPLVWDSTLVTASTAWTLVLIGFIVYYRLQFDFDHVFALLWQLVLFSVLCVCSAHCIIHVGIFDLSMTLTTIFVTIPSMSFLFSNRRPFPPVPYTASLWSFCLILGGYLWFQRLRQSSTASRTIDSPTYVVMFLTFFIVLYLAMTRPNIAYFHPIDMLIYTAKPQHEHYESYATQSYNLEEAAAQYRRRYRMTPPPGFDDWYEYASTRKSVIMDQYDQIYNDMLPFWSIHPVPLRQSTWELVSNPWNDIGGIKIREGKASVLDNVPGTHRWMLEGVASMINKFAQYLPDMDLAFNLNDEARVTVPNEETEYLRKTASGGEDRTGKQSWSADRASGWPAIRDESYTNTILQDMSFRNTFLEYGSIGCHPPSPARRNRDLYTHSHVCVACLAPHSMGQFLSNWTLSGDICHQPDMAHLHGFYLSPAAFRDSHKLVPIFSQSKPHGFNDILYPSAWNYMDKVVYAPTEPSGEPGSDAYNPGHPDVAFEAKQNTLFWRGATSEGVSPGNHTWRGMTRQRLVHLANNLTSSAHDTATILLPTDSVERTRYRYTLVTGPAIKSLGLSTDIAIVDRIARCVDPDCKDQEAEFALVPPADFQSHWQYRYLFDLDGAGFSGRFLAFLQSHSLPFKTALFREWYDERMTAWHHFVPVDIRLHAVWSTLAYFAGVNGTLPGGRRVEMAPHVKEGKRIAEQGREWAERVLRKEDMEIYFFRVLLEWGRLTDDNRENMGFAPGGKG